MMKAMTVKMLISLAAVALAAPFFALALIVGARASALAHDGRDNLMLVALSVVWAALSIINGFGRRTNMSSKRAGLRENAAGEKQALARGASMMNPGY